MRPLELQPQGLFDLFGRSPLALLGADASIWITLEQLRTHHQIARAASQRISR